MLALSSARIDEKLLSVFIPTAPNPTTGWYTLVPESSVKDLDISVEDALDNNFCWDSNPDEKITLQIQHFQN